MSVKRYVTLSKVVFNSDIGGAAVGILVPRVIHW